MQLQLCDFILFFLIGKYLPDIQFEYVDSILETSARLCVLHVCRSPNIVFILNRMSFLSKLDRWFQQGPNPHNKAQDWIYSKGYWDRSYSQLPEIY